MIAATALTLPWRPYDALPSRIQEDFPLAMDDGTVSIAVDEPPPNTKEEIYPGTSTKRGTDSVAVDEPPPDAEEEIYPETSTKRETVHVVDAKPNHVQEDFNLPLNDDTASTEVEKPPPDHKEEVYPGTNSRRAFRVKRGAVLSNKYRWPISKGSDGKNIVKIPYVIGDVSGDVKKWLIPVLDELEQDTCVHFQPRSGEQYYVEFVKGDGGCRSDIGYRENQIQEISLGSGCEYRGTVAHEIMHLLGFYHEHTRQDREQYITVYSENIQPGLESQFEKVQQDNFGVPYDLHSIMQYEEGDFAVSGKKSMESKANPGERLGAISHYDSLDVLKINRMYGCDKPLLVDHTVTVKTGNGWFDGTDAVVFMRLVGTNGQKTPWEQVTSGGRIYADENEAGAVETHHVSFRDVGEIAYAEITLTDGEIPSLKRKRGQINKRMFDGWGLNSVDVDGITLGGADVDVGEKVVISPVR